MGTPDFNQICHLSLDPLDLTQGVLVVDCTSPKGYSSGEHFSRSFRKLYVQVSEKRSQERCKAKYEAYGNMYVQFGTKGRLVSINVPRSSSKPCLNYVGVGYMNAVAPF